METSMISTLVDKGLLYPLFRVLVETVVDRLLG